MRNRSQKSGEELMSARALHVAANADSNLEVARSLVAETALLTEAGISKALADELLPDISADALEARRLARGHDWVVYVDAVGKNVISDSSRDVQRAIIELVHRRLRGRTPITRIARDSFTVNYCVSGDTEVSRRAAEAFAAGVANLMRMYLSDIGFEICPAPDSSTPSERESLPDRHLAIVSTHPVE